MIALYVVSLGISASMIGAFARLVLGDQGFLQGFRMEVTVACGAACAYVSLELAYMGAVQLLKPTRSRAPVFTEILSHLAALVLIPYLAQVRVSWPHPVFERIEPLIYLGTFGALHVFLKLATFFAAIRGEAGGRLPALGWLLGGGVAGVAAYLVLHSWMGELEQARPQVADTINPYRVGAEYALARVVPEGTPIHGAIDCSVKSCLTFRWANPPSAESGPEPLEKIYVTVTLEGAESASQTWPIPLAPAAWTELRIPSERIPEGARLCTVDWTRTNEPAWRKLIPLRPVVTSNREMLLSGPFEHEQRVGKPQEKDGELSILLLVIEGLGTDHVSGLGYKRETTPSLDRVARSALVFPNAYTPAPEAAAACMTILTGVHPLRHGFLGTRQGPLPREYDTLAQVLEARHYATAAFTEGEGPEQKDLMFGAGFERGFELFDPSYQAAETKARTGSAATLAKVQAWIADHADRQYFVFTRLRELGDPRWCDRYAPGFVTNPTTLVPVDVYDSALAYLDRQVGELIKAIRASEAAKTTCIVITSTYGLDFSSRETALPTVGLSESSLRVPLLLYLPNLKKEQRPGLVALEDIAPTLLTLAHTGLDYLVDGKELIQNPAERAPISLFGDPLALSIRIDRWRFSWQSGRVPFAANATGQEYVIELYDAVQARKRGQKINEMIKYPDFATRYRARLNTFLEASVGGPRHSQ